jgi:hypothetical protein
VTHQGSDLSERSAKRADSNPTDFFCLRQTVDLSLCRSGHVVGSKKGIEIIKADGRLIYPRGKHVEVILIGGCGKDSRKMSAPAYQSFGR